MVCFGLSLSTGADTLYGARGGQLFSIDTDTLQGTLVGDGVFVFRFEDPDGNVLDATGGAS